MQTKAQQLADLLETNIWEGKCGEEERDEAAAELRRLDALNAELVEALEFCVGTSYITDAHDIAESALTKAKKQPNEL